MNLSLLVGLIALFAWLLLCTELGVRWGFIALNNLTPYKASYQSFSGTIVGPLSIEKLDLKTKEFDLTIDKTDINWQPLKLFKRVVDIESMMLDGVTYKPAISSKDSTNKPNFTLEEFQKKLSHDNKRFKIKQFTATRVLLDVPTPMTIDRISFNKANFKGRLLVNSLSLEGPFGQLSLHLEDNLKASFDLAIDDLSEWSSSLEGDFRGRGNLSIADVKQWKETSYISAILESDAFQYHDTKIENFSFKTKGKLDNFKSYIQANIHDQSVYIPIKSEIKNDTWQMSLEPMEWMHASYGKLPALSGQASLTKGLDWLAKFSLQLAEQEVLEGNLSISPKQDHRLKGNVHAKMEDMSLLDKISPKLSQAKGTLSLNLDIAGHLDRPVISGNGEIEHLILGFTELGTQLSLEKLTLKNTTPGQLDIEGYGYLGTGRFTLNGETSFEDNKPALSLHLNGQGLILSQTPEYFIKADPNLHLALMDGAPQISGNIFISEAAIHIEQIDSSVMASPDVIIVKNKKQLSQEQPSQTQKIASLGQLKTNIQLKLGDKIKFKGFGLDTKIEGKLAIKGEPNQPLKATGKLNAIKGVYKTRGKKLDLTRAKIIYADSPLSNPSFDIKGQTKIKQTAQPKKAQDYFNAESSIANQEGTIIVGITLQGTLRQPVFKLFSIPKLTDGDILSYLILEKPQSAASLTEGKLLFTAANELMYQFGSQTNDIRPSIQERFNLDKLEFQTNVRNDSRSGLEDAAIVLGKQISKRLYAEYSLGVIDTASSIHLRYLMGNHITLETSASRISRSADILFIFESG